ncbi:uncharacterized protein [Paramisgurnus dabryanus]|uniref:uncharacterized protein n=1 Tax=Paramisgurnus dabryanus TaxID=90735 RepID=UPI003CCF84ED
MPFYYCPEISLSSIPMEREAVEELFPGFSRSKARYSAHFTLPSDVHKRATNMHSTRCSITDRERHESDREAVEEPLPGLRRFSKPNITLAPDVRRRPRRVTTEHPTRCSSGDRVRVNEDAIAQHESGVFTLLSSPHHTAKPQKEKN